MKDVRTKTGREGIPRPSLSNIVMLHDPLVQLEVRRAILRDSRRLERLIPDRSRCLRLEELALLILDRPPSSPRPVKQITLSIVTYCHNGVTVNDLVSNAVTRVILDMPTARCLSMRLLRYSRQGLVTRSAVGREYRYYITRKGRFHRPKRRLSRVIELTMKSVRGDPEYWRLISGNESIDSGLESLLMKHVNGLKL